MLFERQNNCKNEYNVIITLMCEKNMIFIWVFLLLFIHICLIVETKSKTKTMKKNAPRFFLALSVFHFHPLEVVDCGSEKQLQESEYYAYLGQNICINAE